MYTVCTRIEREYVEISLFVQVFNGTPTVRVIRCQESKIKRDKIINDLNKS